MLTHQLCAGAKSRMNMRTKNKNSKCANLAGFGVVSCIVKTIAGLGIVSAFVTSASAQAGESADNWEVIVGGGVMIEPISPGLGETEADPMPYISIKYKDRFFVGRYGVGGYLYKQPDIGRDEGFGVGLALGWSDGRDEDDYPEFLSGMGDIDEGPEASLFVSGEVGRAEYEWSVSKGLEDEGHDGMHSQLNVMFGMPLNQTLFVEAGPFIHWADDDYQQSFYGVTQAQAQLSQFDEYTAESGIDRSGLKLTVRKQLAGNWMLLGLGEYNVMLGDAKDSPLTEDDNYFSYGLALGYRF